ncbi:olfactory receptor 11A1-like [Halichoeres trimaculatus]|uniref:olfactory receptor 11A1-like n=1 Tax=Halichoeres trimaculatus TaxID=147232 RepID=UPI003D9DCA17
MINVTQFSHFRLGGFSETRILKYIYFLVAILIYMLILCANLLLIAVICRNRSLHEPMYMFPCSLFVNELFGSTAFFPLLLDQILSDTHTVSVPLCFLQVYCIYSYVFVEFFNLTVISYDRYVAICYPLQYNSVMTVKRVSVHIAAVWITAFLSMSCILSLTSALQLCGNVIDSIYCNNFYIVKLACSDTRVNNIIGLVYALISILVPLTLIFYTYMRILRVCFSGSKQTRQKAVSTCTPHLVSLFNFSFGICFEGIQNRFEKGHVPPMVTVFMSLYLIICQPVLNPVIYGLKMSKISVKCKSLFCSKVTLIQLR